MKIKFKNPGKSLPVSMVKLGYFPDVDLHLKEDDIYIVYGISIWKGVLHYLIIPTNEILPSWLPADIFEVIDHKLPFDWYFRYFGDNDPSELQIELGYKELILIKNHSLALIERDKTAVRTFLDRKAEIDATS